MRRKRKNLKRNLIYGSCAVAAGVALVCSVTINDNVMSAIGLILSLGYINLVILANS